MTDRRATIENISNESVGDDKPSLGHAVVDGKVRFLSVSAIKLFDRIEEAGCPRRYWFRYVQGIKEPISVAMALGTRIAKEIETFLTEKGDVLSPIARAGRALLPRPGPDLEVELPLGDIHAAVKAREQGERQAIVTKLAGLSVAGIPLMGAADFRHRRGEYIDGTEVFPALRKEDPGMVVTEIADIKTHKRFDDQVLSSGRIERGYAKTIAQILSDTQMLGYGVQEHNRHPEVTHLRLGHVLFRTQGSPFAEKRSGLIPVEIVLRRWQRVEALAREIENVVAEPDVSKIEPNLSACNAYHKPCPYTAHCPKTNDELFTAMFKMTTRQTKENDGMSILTRISKQSTEPATNNPATEIVVSSGILPAQSAIEAEKVRQAAIEAEKAKLLLEDGLSVLGPKVSPDDCDMDVEYLISGNCTFSGPVQITAIFQGSSKGRYFFNEKDGKRHCFDSTAEIRKVKNWATDNPPDAPKITKPHGVFAIVAEDIVKSFDVVNSNVSAINSNVPISAVNPPDAPQFIKIAEPLPSDYVKTIEDPEIHARAEAAAVVIHEEENLKDSGGRCPFGKQRIKLTMEQVAERKMICPQCGKKDVKFKEMIKVGTNEYEAIVAGHNRIIKEVKPEVKPEVKLEVKPEVKSQPEHVVKDYVLEQVGHEQVGHEQVGHHERKEMNERKETVVGKDDETGRTTDGLTTIYLDCMVAGSPQPESFSKYMNEALAPLLKEAGTLDVRIAPEGSPLAFGRWKAFVATRVKNFPLPPGEYLATTHDEVALIMIGAMPPSVRVVRGVR